MPSSHKVIKGLSPFRLVLRSVGEGGHGHCCGKGLWFRVRTLFGGQSAPQQSVSSQIRPTNRSLTWLGTSTNQALPHLLHRIANHFSFLQKVDVKLLESRCEFFDASVESNELGFIIFLALEPEATPVAAGDLHSSDLVCRAARAPDGMDYSVSLFFDLPGLLQELLEHLEVIALPVSVDIKANHSRSKPGKGKLASDDLANASALYCLQHVTWQRSGGFGSSLRGTRHSHELPRTSL